MMALVEHEIALPGLSSRDLRISLGLHGAASLLYPALLGAAQALIRSSDVQSSHLSCRIASTECGAGRDDAVDFRKLLGGQHYVRGAHILLNVLARFRAGYRDDEDAGTLSLDHWPRDGELGERGVV